MCRLREFVPRANRQAIVTAIYPVAHGHAKLGIDMPLMLDGEIGDAAPRVEPVGAEKGIGRADVEARAALAAMIGLGGIGRQIEAEINLAEEQPGAEIARDEVGVLALPAETGLRGQRFFHHRRGVDEDLQFAAPARNDLLRQSLEAPLDQLVIVAVPRIDRDIAARALFQQRQRIVGGAVIQSQHRDAFHLGPQRLGAGARLDTLGEPAHVAVPALRQEFGEPLGGHGGEFRRREANRVEAQR